MRRLNVRIPTEDGVIHAVRDLSFTVEAGDFFGIVGESGSGKSVLVQAIMGLVPHVEVTGEAIFAGRDLLTMTPRQLRAVRGAEVSMIFQDPLSSLHPQFTVGWQLVEQIRTHERTTRAAAKDRAVDMLGKVGIPEPGERFNAYPHQFSGGMRQRVMIAMALSLSPALIIADEPTTALDSTVQTQILDLLREMREAFDVTVVMITHDLTVLGRIANTIMVMYAGHRLELGPAREVFARPAHPYSSGLLRSSPGRHDPSKPLVPIAGRPPSLLGVTSGCVFAARCPDRMEQCGRVSPPLRVYDHGLQAQCWLDRPPSQAAALPETGTIPAKVRYAPDGTTSRVVEPVVRARALELSFRDRRKRREIPVLRGVNLTLERGETLGLVGESGCGKSTLARVLAGLIAPSSGEVELVGRDLSEIGPDEWRRLRKEVQIVFQDPYGALNPRRRVGSIIGDPFRIHKIASGTARKSRVRQLMELVGLEPEHYNRFPSQFSGGQRQRIGIARALALNPALIILDEPVSALDVSVQAQVLNLMKELQAQFDLSYLFISHDLAVVRHMCDRIAVMDNGKIIELATAQELYAHPRQDFTKALLAASAPGEPEELSGTPRLVSTIDADGSEARIA